MVDPRTTNLASFPYIVPLSCLPSMSQENNVDVLWVLQGQKQTFMPIRPPSPLESLNSSTRKLWSCSLGSQRPRRQPFCKFASHWFRGQYLHTVQTQSPGRKIGRTKSMTLQCVAHGERSLVENGKQLCLHPSLVPYRCVHMNLAHSMYYNP